MYNNFSYLTSEQLEAIDLRGFDFNINNKIKLADGSEVLGIKLFFSAVMHDNIAMLEKFSKNTDSPISTTTWSRAALQATLSNAAKSLAYLRTGARAFIGKIL